MSGQERAERLYSLLTGILTADRHDERATPTTGPWRSVLAKDLQPKTRQRALALIGPSTVFSSTCPRPFREYERAAKMVYSDDPRIAAIVTALYHLRIRIHMAAARGYVL